MRRQKRYDDAELLRRLYLDEGMTIAEIARDLGATSVTIQKYLRKFEVPSRGRGPRKGLGRRALRPPQPAEISEALRERLLRLVRAAMAADEGTRLGLLAELDKTISQS